MSDQMVRVFVAGDICPVGPVMEAFSTGDAERVFGDVIPLIQECDYAIGNLECPLCEPHNPILKSGPNLSAPVSSAATLRNAGFKAMGVANNHILDFGPAGLQSTIDACAASGLSTFGAGMGLESAQRPHIVEIRGQRIAFLAIAEDERCLAGPASAGSNPVDPISVVRTLARFRGAFDRLVILLHGGNEGFQFPSPWLRDQSRFLVEQGADVVICQHSHCIGAMETYQRGSILYGQGNFLFNYDSHGSLGGQGLGVVVSFPGDGPALLEFHPLEKTSSALGIQRCSPEGAQRVLEGLRERSTILLDPLQYAHAWEAWCEQRRDAYLTKVFGMGKWTGRLNRGSWMFRFLSARTFLGIYNIVSCESHRATFRGGVDLALSRREKGKQA
jgi:poly-gamma-glutamate capsule biosynthesis protein CapA/YwtB (metallophosphatase superfamily)